MHCSSSCGGCTQGGDSEESRAALGDAMDGKVSFTSFEGTVVFMDLGDSSEMYADQGDAATVPLIAACLRVMEQQVGNGEGLVVKRTGDGVLAVFERPEDAIRAAASTHNSLRALASTSRGKELQVRMGMSHGRAFIHAGDIYGDVVNVAARLLSCACKDEILLTEEVHTHLPAVAQQATRRIGVIAMRHYPRGVVVYRCVQDGRRLTNRVRAGKTTHMSLELTWGSRLYALSAQGEKLRIGRADDNHVRVWDGRSSLYHAEIGVRQGRLVLTDLSTNGTYVQPAGGEPFRVLRDDVALMGSGELRLGALSVTPMIYRVSRADASSDPRAREAPARQQVPNQGWTRGGPMRATARETLG